jgi:tetratricopeptide (TPR) repeat protein
MVFADQATAILQDSFQLPSIKDVLQSSLQLPEEALLLLSLLCSFAPPLYPMDTFLLEACGMRRARWHPCGDPEYFCAEDIGVDPAITNMLRNLTALEHYLGSLEDAKCITRQHGKVEMVAGVISPEIPQDQVVKLACFYYLGCEYSIDYAKIGNSALSLFRRVINQYFRMPNRVRLPLKPLVIDSLLQASKFSTLSWKREIIAIIEREGLESLDNHSKAYFVVRKAFVLRSGGNCRESLELLRDYLHRVPTPLDRKMNAIYGLLTSAMALNLWEIGNFDDAMSSWERWPAQSNSTYESRVAVQTLAHIGRAMLYRRRFHEAVCALKSALESYDRSRPRLDITANLCDAYCESGDREAALKLVASEEPSLTDYLDDRYKRNLAVSYAAAFVCARQYDQAEALLLKLKERFEGKRSLERVDKRRCIRTLLLFAQNLHHQATSPDQWTETKRRWKDVVDSMDGFDEVTEWDFGMVCFSMHHAVQELGGDGGNCWSRRGNEMFARKGKFWMVGMTTYWLQFLSQKVQLPAWITDIGKHSANLYGT